MIPERWQNELEHMARNVDIGLHVVHRRLSGEEATDWMLWAQEMRDAGIEKWEELW